MQGYWLQVLGLYLPIHLFLIFSKYHKKEGKCLKGVPSHMDLPIDTPHIIQNVQIPIRRANSDILPYLPSSGIEYDQRGVNQDRLSTYTSLDDYDAMFEARHGRGVIDNMTVTGGKVSVTSPVKAYPLQLFA